MDLLPTHTNEETLVNLGVDTHADVHVAVALDGLGRRLGHKSVRYRLNRGGNRDANRALHVLALGRMSWDENAPESTSPGARRRARARGRSCGA